MNEGTKQAIKFIVSWVLILSVLSIGVPLLLIYSNLK